eukprot:snap_masked-scaffold_23-processed-gene-5.40-mRNA-1 protein AED:1.00 eAED:1.00 QI:0/-1/0/0/-1/1/1/0/63
MECNHDTVTHQTLQEGDLFFGTRTRLQNKTRKPKQTGNTKPAQTSKAQDKAKYQEEKILNTTV